MDCRLLGMRREDLAPQAVSLNLIREVNSRHATRLEIRYQEVKRSRPDSSQCL